MNYHDYRVKRQLIILLSSPDRGATPLSEGQGAVGGGPGAQIPPMRRWR